MAIRNSILLLAFCIPSGVLAQPAADIEPQALLPEEVLVTGERQVYQLHSKMLEAEKQAYDIFNSLNDEPRFDISCSTHAPTGSRIKQQVCLPGFQLDAYQQHALQYLETLRPDGSNFAIQSQPQEVVIASQQEAYRSKLKQIAEEHPEFLDALIEFTELKERYEEATSTAPE
jgi:hypothetical protein